MTTLFEHPGCNGWAIIDKNQIIGDSAQNYHVVEVKISTDNYGRLAVYLNDRRTTCCTNLRVKTDWSYRQVFHSYQVNALRNTLAEMQNGVMETCGNCAKHFYADRP